MEALAPEPGAVPLTRARVLVAFSGLLLAMLLAALDQTIVATALFAMFGSVTYLPLFLQVVKGASPTGSGL